MTQTGKHADTQAARYKDAAAEYVEVQVSSSLQKIIVRMLTVFVVTIATVIEIVAVPIAINLSIFL